jgi:hypothetical protein
MSGSHGDSLGFWHLLHHVDVHETLQLGDFALLVEFIFFINYIINNNFIESAIARVATVVIAAAVEWTVGQQRVVVGIKGWGSGRAGFLAGVSLLPWRRIDSSFLALLRLYNHNKLLLFFFFLMFFLVFIVMLVVRMLFVLMLLLFGLLVIVPTARSMLALVFGQIFSK